MKIRFVIDSTTIIRESIRHRFSVVPLTIVFGDKEYIEGVTIDEKGFYDLLEKSKDAPVTSQPSPEAFMEAFKEGVDNGETVIAIIVAGGLSGTYQSAVIAASEFPEGSVYVVDSENIAIAAGVLAEYALKLADSGMEAPEIVKRLEDVRKRVRLVALLDTLDSLKKSGRIPWAVAFAGGILSIKPLVYVERGEIKMFGKARGSKKANRLIDDALEKLGGVDFDFPVLFGYTGTDSMPVKRYLEESAAQWTETLDEIAYYIVGSVVGTHAGPGAFAAAYFVKE
ncbi:MAG: DegV family protein [Lachnospiraceae bacterium]|nr:DegV family protein [Lachnospiraceae bacterium]